MSMNGIDYSKRLASERKLFQDAAKTLKESTERRVDETEKRTEHVMAKQKENHIKDRAELETHYQKNMDKMQEKTQAAVDGQTGKMAEKIEEERRLFTEEATKKRKDFDQRLNDIRTSYGKAFDTEKRRNGEVETNQKQKYVGNVENLQENLNEKLADYQSRVEGTGNELKDQYSRERQQLVRAQEDRLRTAYEDGAEKRAELKDRINFELKQAKEVKDAELGQLRKYSQDRLGAMQDQYQTNNDKTSREYSERNSAMVQAQKLNGREVNREHQEDVSKLRRGFNDSLRKIELERRRRDNGSGEFAEFRAKQEGISEVAKQQTRVKTMKENFAELQKNYTEKTEADHTKFQEAFKAQSVEAIAREERKLNAANADKLRTFSSERERTERQIGMRESQNKLEHQEFDSKLMMEQKNSNTRLTKLKESFNQSMKFVEEKHLTTLDEVNKNSTKDKAQFMKILHERKAEDIAEMKRTFGNLMDTMVQDYEQRLSNYERENENLKLTMNQKLHTVMDQTERQLESQRNMFNERRASEQKAQQTLNDDKELQFKRNVADLNNSYQKKIDRMQAQNDTKFKLMINDYESKLKELKALQSKQIVEKDTTHQIELDRVKKAYDDEKTRVVNAYESQIESIKKGHEESMRAMADYKRLS